jgi:hypothetical protein
MRSMRQAIFTGALSTLLLAACLPQDQGPGGAADPASNAGVAGTAAPGFVPAQRLPPLALRSVASAPPPLVTADPAQVRPTQPENVVVAGEVIK